MTAVYSYDLTTTLPPMLKKEAYTIKFQND